MPNTDKKRATRLKVLVSCYACDPSLGSEPGMGGNWVLQLAQHHDLWLLTEENRYAPALTEYLERHCPELKPAIHIIGIPRHRFGEHLWEPLFYYWTYRRWQKDAYREALRLLSEVQFDLAHQLNMIGYREPGYLWKLPIPFIWGPIGGHAQMPCRFFPILGSMGMLRYGLRNIINGIQMRTSIRVRKAMQRAGVLLAATQEDLKAISRIHNSNAVLLSEVGTNPSGAPQKLELYRGERPLRVIWCGYFFARKALPLALKAVQLAATSIPLELHIVGGGGYEKEWKSLANELGISSLCQWHGLLSHQKAMGKIQASDVLLFTSLQEATATVVVEALQFGIPVICHDLCGFGTVVNESSGIKVSANTPATSIALFANALVRLGNNPDLLHSLSRGALQRAEEISWPKQTRIMLECYQTAIQMTFVRKRIDAGSWGKAPTR